MSTPAWEGAEIVLDDDGTVWVWSSVNVGYYRPGDSSDAEGARSVEDKYGPCRPLIVEDQFGCLTSVVTLDELTGASIVLACLTGAPQRQIEREIANHVAVWDDGHGTWDDPERRWAEDNS